MHILFFYCRSFLDTLKSRPRLCRAMLEMFVWNIKQLILKWNIFIIGALPSGDSRFRSNRDVHLFHTLLLGSILPRLQNRTVRPLLPVAVSLPVSGHRSHDCDVTCVPRDFNHQLPALFETGKRWVKIYGVPGYAETFFRKKIGGKEIF